MNRALRTHTPEEPPDIKVVVLDLEGHFLAAGENHYSFTNDRRSATVFDLRSDNVEAQLAAIRKSHGIQLVTDPVPLSEIYESCDCCKELFMPSMIYFDGRHCLCPDCRKLSASGRHPTRVDK